MLTEGKTRGGSGSMKIHEPGGSKNTRPIKPPPAPKSKKTTTPTTVKCLMKKPTPDQIEMLDNRSILIDCEGMEHEDGKMREPTDEDWKRLRKGMPFSKQEELCLSYNHCTNCGVKMDYNGNHRCGDGIYCDGCFLKSIW
jgi:hypothetical protein